MNVCAGLTADEFVTAKTVISLTRMFNSYPEFESRLILTQGGCGDYAGNRNKLARAFLSTGIDWLLWIDSDMEWDPKDWGRLSESADEKERPWVSGTYFVANEPLRPCALIYKDTRRYVPLLDEDSPELLQVSAACIGFGLMHRRVFLEAGDMTNDHEWFEHGWRDPHGETMSEDYAFASRAGEAGIPIYLNTKVRLGHVKSRVIGWDDYKKQEQVGSKL